MKRKFKPTILMLAVVIFLQTLCGCSLGKFIRMDTRGAFIAVDESDSSCIQMFSVDSHIMFVVDCPEEGEVYSLVSEDGADVGERFFRLFGDTGIIVYPNGGYEEGREYRLDLYNGSSVRTDGFENADTVVFQTSRRDASSFTYNDGVIVEDANDISAVSDSVIRSDNNYNVGDIVVAEYDDGTIFDIQDRRCCRQR